MINIKYKSLSMFFLAANSLLASGYLAYTQIPTWELPLLLWIGICGIFIVYRLNDFIDQSTEFKFNIHEFLKIKANLFFLIQFVFVALPISFLFLSSFRLIILASVALLGTFYSFNFKLSENNFRLKKLFLFKNLFIGVSWGALVLIGANTITEPIVIAIFTFCSIQVLIGSIIRDLPDVEKDFKESVRSLPVVLGISPTLTILHALNILSILSGIIAKWEINFLILIILVISFRSFLLLKIKTNYSNCKYTQSWNLFTCVLIFLIIFIQSIYANR